MGLTGARLGAALHACEGQGVIAFTLPRSILLKPSLREVSVKEKEALSPPPVQVVWQNFNIFGGSSLAVLILGRCGHNQTIK